MIFFNSLYDISYYNPQPPFGCYCELLVLPGDLQMQHALHQNANTTYDISITVLSPDGLTSYGNATNYFAFTITSTYFLIQLNTFAPPMCDHECWILHVEVSRNGDGIKVLDLWTDKFCNVACCSAVTSIDIDGATHTLTPTSTTADCNVPVVRLETWFDCFDKFTGQNYTTGFRKITNIRGRFIRLPREIKKETSINCRVQKVQSFRVFQLEGWDYYPQWKMDEIELQLQANNILVDGSTFIYPGGQVFTKPNICQDIYLLRTEFNECNTWQIFGCEDCNTGASRYFTLYSEGSFYDENLNFIGDSTDDLLLYFRSLPNVTAVTQVYPIASPVCYASVIQVTGTGYIPTYIYMDGLRQGNRIYGANNSEVECSPVLCEAPVIASAVPTVADCPVPSIADVRVTRQSTNFMAWNTYSIPIFEVAEGNERNYNFYNMISGELISVEIDGLPVPLDTVGFDNTTGDIILPEGVTTGQSVQIIYKVPQF